LGTSRWHASRLLTEPFAAAGRHALTNAELGRRMMRAFPIGIDGLCLVDSSRSPGITQSRHGLVGGRRPSASPQLSARSETVRETCLADVDRCDLYVLILGHRYGWQSEHEQAAEKVPGSAVFIKHHRLNFSYAWFGHSANGHNSAMFLRRSGFRRDILSPPGLTLEFLCVFASLRENRNSSHNACPEI
jgi:Domain of unknown function (DUF4062)